MPQGSEACKAKCLAKNERVYYIFLLGTDEASRGKGLCSQMVRFYQDKAKQENVAIYMEASTEASLRLYERLGFVTIDEWPLGKGVAGADGLPEADGPGCKLWGMVWRPREMTKKVDKA